MPKGVVEIIAPWNYPIMLLLTPVASAFAAYGHYASLFTIAGALAVERVTVTAKPTKEQLDRLVAADSIYGIAGVILLGTGYMRAKYYGKGLEWNLFPPFANSLHNNKTNSTISGLLI